MRRPRLAKLGQVILSIFGKTRRSCACVGIACHVINDPLNRIIGVASRVVRECVLGITRMGVAVGA
jgi:hypothetical protein